MSTRPPAHSILTFYLLAFAISWAGYLPLLFARDRANPLWLLGLLLPAVGPAVAAWIAAAREGAPGSGWSRLRESVARRVSWRWWVTAAFLPAALLLLANALSRWFLPGHAPLLRPASAAGIVAASVFACAANPWEEVGWRGFALTRLQGRFHPALAALIVGVLWAAWHLPLFFIPMGTPVSMATIPFWPWAAGLVGRSFLYAWVFNAARRNLAVVALLHIAFNVSGAIHGVGSLGILSVVETAAALSVLCASEFRPSPGTQETE